MCPPEIREGHVDLWPHVDQAILRGPNQKAHNNNLPDGFISESLLATKPYTIQGQFLFEDSLDGDGGFYCIPQSHLRFNEFAPAVEAIDALGISRDDKRMIRNQFLTEFFKPPNHMKHITAARGSLILWDSRTVHWNQHPDKHRIQPKVRMAGYLCYVPESRLTDEGIKMRREAFEKGISTGHNPAYPELKPTIDRLPSDYFHYREDSSYIQPIIQFYSIGKSLLGF